MSSRRAFGPRSLRSRPSLAVQELEPILRQVGRPSREVAAALLAAAARMPPARKDPKLVARFISEATSICKTAHLSFRRYNLSQRAALRGFSTELLAVAAMQVIELDRTYRLYQRDLKDLGEVGARLATAALHARGLCEQAHAVLAAVSAGEISLDLETPIPSDPDGVRFAMMKVSRQARSILTCQTPSVRQRCRSYGLDDGYLVTIEASMTTISDIIEKSVDDKAVEGRRADLDYAFCVAAAAVLQIADAFDLAHRVDGAIMPLANAVAVRRASTMAPPIERSAAPVVAGHAHPPLVVVSPAPAQFARRVILIRDAVPKRK